MKSYQWLQVVYCFTYGTMCLLSLALIVYLRRNRSTAYGGDADAAQKVVLPAFESLFWVMAAVTGLYTVFFIVASITDFAPFTVRWFAELLPQGRQFTYFLLVVLLMQRSLTRQALVRTVVVSAALAAAPVLLVVILEETTFSEGAKVMMHHVLRGGYVAWFVVLFLRPVSRASVRTQREFYAYVLVYFAAVYVFKTLFHNQDLDNGTVVVFLSALYGAVAPLFAWRLLIADTQYWRGVGDRAIDFQLHCLEAQGMQEIVSAQGLHVLLELHRKDIIDFTHLQLQRQVGSGATAHVFRGLLHSSTPVAVKVYSPTEISEAVIVEFSKETLLCAALKHPNIVYFHGMCIQPPSICLVYELCRGSLEDVLTKQRHAMGDYVEPLWPKLCYMLDAARAVAHLHSFSPPFLHRDIKPANLLIDGANVVKLTDFGEARSMASRMADSVCGTVEYMAPEVIDGKQGVAAYSESADIYSLAVTMWDILHPGQDKYPTSKQNHLNIFQTVLDGQRPPIDPEIHPTLHELLENCWNADPAFRPSAKMVVATLEDMHEDLAGQVAFRLAECVTYVAEKKSKKAASATATPPKLHVAGSEIVRCLLEHRYAFEKEEALRLGNALMDAGCLHHTKHCMAFENSSTATFSFDTHQLDMNKPLPNDMRGVSTVEEATSALFAGTSALGDGASGLCACRKLGQGHHNKPRGKKLFHRRKGNTNALTVNLLNQSGDCTDFATSSSATTSTPCTLSLKLV